MRILITGGAGYLGSQIAHLLKKQKHESFVFDNAANPAQDICNIAAIKSAFASFKPDAVIHLAAQANLGICETDPAAAHEVNVEGTRNILNAMREYNVPSLAFASSCAIYADSNAALKETNPTGPASVYGKTKILGETLIREYEDINSVIFRIYNIAGADPEGAVGECHHPETHLIPLAIDALNNGRQFTITGGSFPTPDGTAIRDYIHVADAANAFILAVKYLNKEKTSTILNLGSGIPHSVKELLQKLDKVSGKTLDLVVIAPRKNDGAHLLADNSRIKQTLKWQPEFSDMETILKTALNWHAK